MSIITSISTILFHNINPSKSVAVVLGNLFLGLGVAGMLLSGLGNDPSTAMNMAISDGFGMGLGTYQLLFNLAVFITQIFFGRKYIGIGTIINMVCIGYIVQYSSPIIDSIFGNAYGASFLYQLYYMFLSLLVLSFGISMYQLSNQGVAPYDYISLALTDKFKKPYFLMRIGTDFSCILVILSAFLVSFIDSSQLHLGVSTLVAAFCFGPFISMFNKLNCKWIKQ